MRSGPSAEADRGDMTRRAPSFARAFTGRWRITEMDEWDEIDLAGSAHITLSGKDRGEIAFLAVEADLDVRYGWRDGAACAEFSWKASMTVPPPAAAAGPLWGAPAVWSVTSSSIKVMTQASSPNASDFFNSLLSGSLAPRAAGAVALAADRLSGSAAVPSNGRYRKGFGCRPSERSTRVYDTCRDGNGHIRLFAKRY